MKRIIRDGLLVALMAAFLGQPVLTRQAYGQSVPDICEAASSNKAAVTERFNRKASELDATLSTETQEITARSEASFEAVATERAESDQKLEAAIASYIDKQDDPARRQAAITYGAAITTAVETRRQSYDEAQRAFTAGVQAQREERQLFLREATAAYREAVLSAIDDTATGCRRFQPDKAGLRTQLTTVLQRERAVLQTQIGSRNPAEGMKELIAIRDRAFDMARAEFEQSLQEARAQLND